MSATDVPMCAALKWSIKYDDYVCGGPMVTTAEAHWNHRAEPEHRLVCCACGEGRVGTDEEVAQAEAARKVHEADMAYLYETEGR